MKFHYSLAVNKRKLGDLRQSVKNADVTAGGCENLFFNVFENVALKGKSVYEDSGIKVTSINTSKVGGYILFNICLDFKDYQYIGDYELLESLILQIKEFIKNSTVKTEVEFMYVSSFAFDSKVYNFFIKDNFNVEESFNSGYLPTKLFASILSFMIKGNNVSFLNSRQANYFIENTFTSFELEIKSNEEVEGENIIGIVGKAREVITLDEVISFTNGFESLVQNLNNPKYEQFITTDI